MISDDGGAYTHFCYAKSSKEGSSWKKNRCPKLFVPTSRSEVFFRPRSRSKTQTVMFLGGEASYRLENRILGNDFGRRRCLYPLLLGQIFKKKQFLKKKWRPEIFVGPPLSEVFFRPRSRSKTQKLMYLAGEASYRPEKHIQGNEFWRRSCLYPLLLGQIFKKKQFFKKTTKITRPKNGCFFVDFSSYRAHLWWI